MRNAVATADSRAQEGHEETSHRRTRDAVATADSRAEETIDRREGRQVRDRTRRMGARDIDRAGIEAEATREKLHFGMKEDDLPKKPELQRWFERCPETAAFMYHLNSGTRRFHQLDKLDSTEEGTDEHARLMHELGEEIKDQVPSDYECNETSRSSSRPLDGGI